MNAPQPAFEALLAKVEAMRVSKGVDLSTEEDLCIAVMNLVSLEEHFFFTAVKTEKPAYFDLLEEARAMRKDLLGKLIDRHEGETWCISKHLLATTMRLIEVGTKLRSAGKRAEAEEMFSRARKTWTMFWALRLKLVDAAGFRQAASAEKPWSLQDIVDKLVDCCDE